MEATFVQRLCAYVIDILIVSIFLSLITYNINFDKLNDLNKQLNNLLEKGYVTEKQDKTDVTVEEELTMDEYNTKLFDIQYEIEKESILINTISIVIIIGYFIAFQYFNKGQTIGKKLLKIKLTSTNHKKIRLWQVIVRSIIIYGILTGILNIIFINIVNKNTYLGIYNIFTIIQSIFIIVSVLFILYRKDKRGLHDLMSKSSVVLEKGE